MFCGNADLPAVPGFTNFHQAGIKDLQKDDLDIIHALDGVQDLFGLGFVVGCQGFEELIGVGASGEAGGLGGLGCQHRWQGLWPDAFLAQPAIFAHRVADRKALIEPVGDPADDLDIALGIQAVIVVQAVGVQQIVAPFPGAQRDRAHASPLTEDLDGVFGLCRIFCNRYHG